MSASPLEECAGCGDLRDEIELMRVVNNKGEVKVDPGSDLPGRGIYLCPQVKCLDLACEKNALKQELKVEITDELYESLVEEIKHG
ncbi:YlxR family protein [Halarsenatibacter silvermanii]|uniref:YlxR domain-containing protein n=1 Tax=Halarsenatibacter silvermanii TaxID=321763 RepID=A0A1G9LHJ3_9FIRM|nr:YlxR family protein [Halarsenatibacter silvermanii]SDL61328.1 hypothetical protein SAMN04488692_10662 [Halarsenatibacter silvermanii]